MAFKRRAQLVAHIGEKHALGLVGRLGRVAGEEQFRCALLDGFLQLVFMAAQSLFGVSLLF